MKRRIALVALAIGLLSATAVASTGTATAQDEVTMTIGLTQPWETLNPLVGFAVSEYEFWNVQYLGLTSRSADDFSPTPGLAEAWVENEPGLSYTYTLRDGLQWSDGEPLTAEDIAWNINTSRDQEWTNYISSVVNLTAEVVDERTVTITSSVPDPKLPAVEIYFVPKHIWEPVSETGEIESYEALDGVGSGPFVLDDYQSEESLTMVANEHYYDGQRPIDRIIFRYFSNPDAMVAALERGEIDAAHDLPASSMEGLGNNPDIEVVNGLQGGFDEIALNGGAAPTQPHPALLDLEFRKAINYAIDKEGATEDLWFGLAEPATAISVGADLKWVPEIPEDEQLSYDLEKAIATLDAAGYVDTNGDGIREMPGGGDNIVLRHAVNTDGDLAPEMGELFSGWMNAVGIGVQLDAYDQDQLTGVIIDGTYDSFFWGWTPFVDPNPMLSYFTAAEIGSYNDANWTNERYEELFLEQREELDPDRRLEIVHEMVRIMYDDAAYIAMWYSGDLQGYRTDRFEGFVRQPAEVGPVLFSNSSPSYASLQPIGGGSSADDDDGSNVLTIVIVVAAVAAVLGLGALAILRRRKSVDDRE
jgi:peptide/nickel transport system substrate-binding protein